MKKFTKSAESEGVKLCVCVGILAGVTAVIIGVIAKRVEENEEIYQAWKSHEEILFENLDVNSDGVLSLEEFAVVAIKITGKHWDRLNISEEFLTMATSFEPLNLSSLRGFTEDHSPIQEKESSWNGFVAWKTSSKQNITISTRQLYYFLPPLSTTRVGVPWALYLQQGGSLSNDRHEPPQSAGIEAVLQELLEAFHPRPFLQTRFGPQGGHALIRAKSEDFYDISFRFHAEFQLNEPPILPFWFTPAQFSGNLVVSKNGSNVRNFRMFVPSKHKLNVDMELVTDIGEADSLVAEIGFMPRMELKEIGPSRPNTSTLPLQSDLPKSIVWQEQISPDEADLLLEKSFYPFKQVTLVMEYYYSLRT